MTASIGIDLGTTFSAIARLTERRELSSIVNAEGERTTPSVVLFEGDEVVVGKEALKALATNADGVAQCSKRAVGLGTFHKPLNGQYYAPEIIEAWVLNKLRNDAAQQIGPFDKVVITVPAYFDEVRRKATQDAGYIAGLDVMDIINEPTAAAIAFGYQQGTLATGGNTDRPLRFVMYDLGGGTFDVTVMEIRGNEFVTLSTDGDTGLGGYDWDQRLVNLVAERFAAQHGLDPREDANTAGRLWRECEDAKRTLSARHSVAVPCDYRGFASRVEVTRQQFEEATQDLLDATRFTTGRAVQAAGLDWSHIDRLLLVGGSTRMPMVRNMLREISGLEPDASVAADEAVAHGAALHADMLLTISQGQPPAFSIQNVNSHSLGVVGTDVTTGQKKNAIVIPRNTPLPVSMMQPCTTKRDNQPSVVVRVVEGESLLPDDCTEIGRVTIHGLPPLPAGSPIEVHYNYHPNGRLYVQVGIPGADRVENAEFVRENRLTKELLDAWRQHVSGMPPTDYE